MVSRFDPASDKEFEDLARLLAVRRRQRKLKPGEEWMEEMIEPNDIYFQEQFRGADLSAPGPGFAFDPRETFTLDLYDKGAGEVNIVPQRGPAGTFTRATTATTVLSSGLIASVASGVPRSYYDPTTLTYLGYLTENQRTNLLLRSEEFDNASWSKTDTTITANNTTAPDGATTADLLTEGVAGTAQTVQAVTATADVNYAYSVFLKPSANNDWVVLQFGSGANAVLGWVNITTGSAGSTAVAGTGVAVGITTKVHPSGWVRATLVGSVGSGATAITSQIKSASANSTNTRVNNAAYFSWGAQFEDNAAYASSYIPTTTASIQRNGDSLTYSATWANGELGGSAIVRYSSTVGTQAGFNRVYQMDDTTNNNRVTVLDDGVGSMTQNVFTNNIFQAGGATRVIAQGELKTYGSSWRLNSFVNVGDTTATDTSGIVPAMHTLGVGNRPGGLSNLFGTVRAFRGYATHLSASQLEVAMAALS